MVHNTSGLKGCAPFKDLSETLQHLKPGLISCATFKAKPIQTAGGAGKNRFFGGFLPVFCPVVCILLICINIIRIFKKKILFAKKAFNIQIAGKQAKNRTKNWQKTSKETVFFQLLRLSVWVWPEMLRKFSGLA